MKHFYLIAISLLLVAVPPASIAGDAKPLAAGTASGTTTTAESLHAKNVALMDKATRDQDEAHKRNSALMDSTERDITRQEQDMGRVEKGLARQEQDFGRFEKILDTWERQQAQYQKYLDSLPKVKDRK